MADKPSTIQTPSTVPQKLVSDIRRMIADMGRNPQRTAVSVWETNSCYTVARIDP